MKHSNSSLWFTSTSLGHSSLLKDLQKYGYQDWQTPSLALTSENKKNVILLWMEIKDLILLNIYVPDCLDNYCLLINEIVIFNDLTYLTI